MSQVNADVCLCRGFCFVRSASVSCEVSDVANVIHCGDWLRGEARRVSARAS